MEHKVEYDPTNKLIVVDGETYIQSGHKDKMIDGVHHTKIISFRKASLKEINETVNNIVNKIKGKTSKEELLRQLIREKLSGEELSRVSKEAARTKKVTKQKGCLGFKIGRKYIQLID